MCICNSMIERKREREKKKLGPIILFCPTEDELFSGNTKLILQTNYILNTEYLPITKHK